MKLSVIGIGLGAFLLFNAGTASAACTNLADPGAECKALQKCQATIMKSAASYVATVQKTQQAIVNASQGGKISAGPVYSCKGGSKVGKSCTDNNGRCKAGADKGARCSIDADCALSVCDHNKGCNLCGKVVAGQCDDGSLCATNEDCNDINECQPNALKEAYGKDIDKAKKKLRSALVKGCVTTKVPISANTDLGLSNLPICVNQDAGGTPDIDPGDDDETAMGALADCIERSVRGDLADPFLNAQKVHDTILTHVAKGIGTGGGATRPQSKPGQADSDPRMVIQLQGSSILQVGNGSVPAATSRGNGGGRTNIGLADCKATGNQDFFCLNNKDCGTGGVCSDNCIGDTCAGKGTLPFGNTLAVTAGCDPTSIATCLYTKTLNAGNGTGANVVVDLASGSTTSVAPIVTNVHIAGIAGPSLCPTYNSCPICTPDGGTLKCEGECISLPTLIAQGVKCTQNSECAGHPGGALCTADLNGAGASSDEQLCNTDSAGGATQECKMPAASVLVGGTLGGAVPNAFALTSGSSFLAGSADPGAGANEFCGFCDISGSPDDGVCTAGAALCAVGCTEVADCNPHTGSAPGTECDFGASNAGFAGDALATAMSTDGSASQYAPTLGGTFCAGQSGNPTIDGARGLPGPVRFLSDYTYGYTYTKDK